MKQYSKWFDHDGQATGEGRPSRAIPFNKFLMRYPIFILAFGPPIFRTEIILTDTSQAHFDIWNILQVGLLCLIALRAILRLAAPESILIPKQIRSILRLSFFLGLLFLISVGYSPGRIVSAEFSILYFLMLICVIEFVVDVYQNPPNWINCLFYLRQILLLLFALVLLVLFIDPKLVMMIVREGGIRLLGGHVATMTVVPEFIAIISAYSFLYSLEPRVKSTLFFLIGLTGTLVTQARGAEIGLFISLAILCVVWAKDKKRSVSILISGVIACVLLAWTVAGTVGAENIWDTFNRGQDAEGIATASGRSEVWSFAIQYCIAHPQGMGYVAGFRSIFTKHFSLMLNLDYSHLGNTHNSFLQVLVDAGWVALALYLAMLAKTIALGLRLAKKRVLVELPSNSVARHAIRCGLLLLLYCFLCGMGGSDFCVPLQPCFYYQNIIIAVILGASARLLAASRSRELFIAK